MPEQTNQKVQDKPDQDKQDQKKQGSEAAAPDRPAIPLSASHLLVNGPRDHTVSSEIQRELASADRVDLLVSVLKWPGWRLLRDEVRQLEGG